MITMSEREIEVSVLGAKFRYKRIRKPTVLDPCQHSMDERGFVKKRVITFHGKDDGSERMERHEI